LDRSWPHGRGWYGFCAALNPADWALATSHA
jgi:hypothetical protein